MALQQLRDIARRVLTHEECRSELLPVVASWDPVTVNVIYDIVCPKARSAKFCWKAAAFQAEMKSNRYVRHVYRYEVVCYNDVTTSDYDARMGTLFADEPAALVDVSMIQSNPYAQLVSAYRTREYVDVVRENVRRMEPVQLFRTFYSKFSLSWTPFAHQWLYKKTNANSPSVVKEMFAVHYHVLKERIDAIKANDPELAAIVTREVRPAIQADVDSIKASMVPPVPKHVARRS